MSKDPEARKKLKKMEEEFSKVRKEVFTDERKIEQRKEGFKRAKSNIKQTFQSEFAM